MSPRREAWKCPIRISYWPLLARDGPQSYRTHRLEGRCRYEDLYPEGDCPWCEAEDQQVQLRRRRPLTTAALDPCPASSARGEGVKPRRDVRCRRTV